MVTIIDQFAPGEYNAADKSFQSVRQAKTLIDFYDSLERHRHHLDQLRKKIISETDGWGQKLPSRVLLLVMSMVPFETLICAELVCSNWQRALNNPELWRHKRLGDIDDALVTTQSTPLPMPPSEEEQLKSEAERREGKRQKSLSEIIETEEKYVNNLNIIIEHFMGPFYDNFVASKSSPISHQHMDDIFSNIKEIKQHHETLLGELKTTPDIGACFCKHYVFMKMYTVYVNNYSNSMSQLETLKKDKSFETFLLSYRSNPKTGNLDLMSYLIMPVQRIPRYALLLREVLKYTAESTIERSSLVLALKHIQEIASEINEAKRAAERLDRLQEIQRRIKSEYILTTSPSRVFIRESKNFFMKGKPMTFFLFNDILLWCDKVNKLQGVLQLRHGDVEVAACIDKKANQSMRFGLSVHQVGQPPFIINCPNKQIRDRWAQDFKEIYEESIAEELARQQHEEEEITNEQTPLPADPVSPGTKPQPLLTRQKSTSTQQVPAAALKPPVLVDSGPPLINLKIEVLSGRDLASKDMNGLSDPFLKIRGVDVHNQALMEFRSKTCYKTLNPEWNMTCGGPFSAEILSKLVAIWIEVWDWDKYKSDDFMGEAFIPLSEGSEALQTTPFKKWHRLQKSQLEKWRNEEVKGDVLVQIEAERAAKRPPLLGHRLSISSPGPLTRRTSIQEATTKILDTFSFSRERRGSSSTPAKSESMPTLDTTQGLFSVDERKSAPMLSREPSTTIPPSPSTPPLAPLSLRLNSQIFTTTSPTTTSSGPSISPLSHPSMNGMSTPVSPPTIPSPTITSPPLLSTPTSTASTSSPTLSSSSPSSVSSPYSVSPAAQRRQISAQGTKKKVDTKKRKQLPPIAIPPTQSSTISFSSSSVISSNSSTNTPTSSPESATTTTPTTTTETSRSTPSTPTVSSLNPPTFPLVGPNTSPTSSLVWSSTSPAAPPASTKIFGVLKRQQTVPAKITKEFLAQQNGKDAAEQEQCSRLERTWKAAIEKERDSKRSLLPTKEEKKDSGWAAPKQGKSQPTATIAPAAKEPDDKDKLKAKNLYKKLDPWLGFDIHKTTAMQNISDNSPGLQSKPPIQKGWLLSEMNGTAIKTPQNFKKVLKALHPGEKVVCRVITDTKETILVAIEVGCKNKPLTEVRQMRKNAGFTLQTDEEVLAPYIRGEK